jgi:hypothetical protein
MPYIYSSLSADHDFVSYDNHPRVGTPKAGVTIKGKANVQDAKTLETPQGVATRVSDEELELLKSIPSFNDMVKGGYLVIDEKAAHGHDADERGASMPKDKSKQDTAKDYEAMGKKAPKEEKAKK